MKRTITPAFAGIIIGIAVVVIAALAWRAFTPSAPIAEKPITQSRGGGPAVTRAPDGSVQLSPEAQAQRGPSMEQRTRGAGGGPSPQ